MFKITPLASAIALACACTGVHAASSDAPAAPTQASPSQPTGTAQLPPVVVTGNPLRHSEVAAPLTTLSGDALVLRRGSTLGETLDQLPGVSASSFGPNASRPIIRGQDGDRIRVLSNSGASLDASSLSNDHAVAIDPLAVERIEVLRGPAALLYGGSAVGGVVNTIDNRIPRQSVGTPTGAVELRLGGASQERGASALVEAGAAGFSLHADGFWRETHDLKVPAFNRPLGDGTTEQRTTVVNSASRSEGGALGGSLVWNDGYLGASVDTYRTRYGTVVEEDVHIQMFRDKFSLAGELRRPSGAIRSLRGQAHFNNYQHQELEGTGEVATTFKNRGSDARFELEHAPVSTAWGTFSGIFGLQTEDARFSALGSEAFVPSTRSKQTAGFVHEELALPVGKLSFGGRVEHSRVSSQGDEPDALTPRFGAAQTLGYQTLSAAAGMEIPLTAQWQWSTQLAYTERAPTFYELFANGVHVATATYERGSTSNTSEKGRNIDMSLQWKEGKHQWKVSAFASHFPRYIALLPTQDADFVDDAGEPFPIHAFQGVPARFLGFETEGTWQALSGPTTLAFTGQFDMVRANRTDTGEPLPRIAPRRATLGITLAQGIWSAHAEVQRVTAQTRVSAQDSSTPGYTLVNLSGVVHLGWAGTDTMLFAKLNNLGNVSAYNATATATVRPLSPLAGRNLSVGLRMSF